METDRTCSRRSAAGRAVADDLAARAGPTLWPAASSAAAMRSSICATSNYLEITAIGKIIIHYSLDFSEEPLHLHEN